MERAAKAEQVTELKEVFKTAKTVVVAHYAGLTVAKMQILRKQARQAGTTVKVAKNRLAKIALEGTDVASIGPLLKGPTVIAYSNDPVGASKVASDFAKAHEKFVILGGAMGDLVLDPAGVKAVSALPSREELIASIVACLGAPASALAGAIGAPASNIASILSTIEEKAAA